VTSLVHIEATIMAFLFSKGWNH